MTTQSCETQRPSPFLSRVLRAVLLPGLLFGPGLSAQSPTGAITGTARDPTHAVVPGAQVTLTNVNTNERRVQTTGAEGAYTFPALSPGVYRLEAERAGFKKFVRPNLNVEVQQQAVIDIVLDLGEVTQTVEITAETPLLQPATSSLGQVATAADG